jgi:hypothetical protein
MKQCNSTTAVLQSEEVPWDIPVLNVELSVRKRLFEQAVEHARQEGFMLRTNSGLILAWKDWIESSLLQCLAFRAWACTTVSLSENDLKKFSDRLCDFGAGFAAISSWIPFPECKQFLNVGTSIHALLLGTRHSRVSVDNARVFSFGDVPEHYVSEIVNHVKATQWHDRHANDNELSNEVVRRRRTSWIQDQLHKGDGFLVAVMSQERRLGAYLAVPIDRSRVAFGGPVVAGINAVAGSIIEGRWYASLAIVKAVDEARKRKAQGIAQYQPSNKAISYIIRHIFNARECTRYDLHWHGPQ